MISFDIIIKRSVLIKTGYIEFARLESCADAIQPIVRPTVPWQLRITVSDRAREPSGCPGLNTVVLQVSSLR